MVEDIYGNMMTSRNRSVTVIYPLTTHFSSASFSDNVSAVEKTNHRNEVVKKKKILFKMYSFSSACSYILLLSFMIHVSYVTN